MQRVMASVLLVALSGGCTTVTMREFDELAALGGERIDVTGIPAWRDGSFAIGTSKGQVRRRAVGMRQEWSDDPWGVVSRAVIARTGTFTFDAVGPDVGGRIEGRCRYGRFEGERRMGDFAIGHPVRPLRLGCRFAIDGRDAGELDLRAAPPMAPIAGEVRAGLVRLDGITLDIRSTTDVAGQALPIDSPVGYALATADGVTIGAIETTGGGRRRLIVPRGPVERRAVIAATLALALFWDPGDVD